MPHFLLSLLLPLSAFTAEQHGVFGQAPTLKEPVPLSKVLADPSAYAKGEVLLEGKAEKVCQKKGCWFTLKDGDKDIRITFKDYAFFIPKESVGKRIRAQGAVEELVVSVREARHYLKDEGAPKSEIKKIKAPVKTASFVASGLEILGN